MRLSSADVEMEGRRYGEKATGLMLGPTWAALACHELAQARGVYRQQGKQLRAQVCATTSCVPFRAHGRCRAPRQCAVQSKRAHPPACRGQAQAHGRLSDVWETASSKCELLQPPACHFGRTGGVESLGNVLCNPSVVILLRAGGKPRRTGRLSDVWGEWVRLYLRF